MIETLTPICVTVDGFEPSPALERFLLEARPFGVLLFDRHLKSEGQVQELNAWMRSILPGLNIALDQEGGRVSRLKTLGFDFPGASALDSDPERAMALGSETGEALARLGFNVDFAPVADLGPVEQGTGLEGRVFADDPESVAACCASFLEGLAASGIRGCLKHFPGLGGSRCDSHKSLPYIGGGVEARREHLVPYQILAPITPFVMMAHGRYDIFEDPAPSSLNPEAYDLLRDLDFAGQSITDDLCMGAVASEGTLAERVAKAMQAGADIALWVSTEADSLAVCKTL